MSGALLKTPLRQVADVKHLLMNEQARDQLAMVAAKHINPERMMRVIANAIRTTPLLQDCEPMSFLGALMHCASMGLEPNTPLGHAYLIPFKNNRKNIVEVQVVIGYKGFIDLARRSGQLASIHGDVVYSDDEVWSHEYGSNQHLRHRPGPRKGKRIGAYCHVKLNLGEGITAEGHRFMTMDEIVAHRDRHSQGWKTAVRFNKTADSPWNEANPQFEAMAIKTVVRALANRGELPMSIEFMEAMASDEQRIDYRTFAMDPTQGVTIEGEADAVENDGAVEAEAKQIEQTQTQRANFDQQEQRQADPAPRKQQPAEERQKPAGRRDSGPYAEGAPKLSEKRREAQAEPEQATMFEQKQAAPGADAWCQQFLQDVKDVGFDQASDLHLTQLREVQNADPEKHYWLMEQVQLIEDAARD